MLWEILVLTQPSRAAFLAQLSYLLDAQWSSNPDVCAHIRQFDPTMTLGENREILRRASKAEYISFVDDDDFVPPDYVDKILPLLDGVDQVGFNVQIFKNNVPYGLAVHGLHHGGWTDKMHFFDFNGNGRHGGHLFERDISHLNPMRRELALQVPMSGGIGEDHRWANGMRGRVKTEHFLNEVMYYYLWREPKDDTKDQVSEPRLRLWESLKRCQHRIESTNGQH